MTTASPTGTETPVATGATGVTLVGSGPDPLPLTTRHWTGGIQIEPTVNMSDDVPHDTVQGQPTVNFPTGVPGGAFQPTVRVPSGAGLY